MSFKVIHGSSPGLLMRAVESTKIKKTSGMLAGKTTQPSQDKSLLCGKRIGFQHRSKSRMALQELSNDSFHSGWILQVPVAQPVKRTFPTSI